MKGVIAVFGKTPGLSPLKTRLAEGIGQERAEEFYRLSVDCVEEVLTEVVQESQLPLTPVWVLAEEQGPCDLFWAGRTTRVQDLSWRTQWTGEGGLGDRLHRVYSSLLEEFDFVLLLGTDSPQLEASTILNVVSKFKDNKNNAILGPCPDGGFYVFGSNLKIDKRIWLETPYSCEETSQFLIARLEKLSIQVNVVKSMQDVDFEADLYSLLRELRDRTLSLQSQKKLLTWIEHL